MDVANVNFYNMSWEAMEVAVNQSATFSGPGGGATKPSVVLWTIIDGSLLLAILGGNTLTICAVRLSRKLSNVISNQFVLSLALSDFLVGLTLPYHLAFYIGSTLAAHKSTCLLRFVLISMACCASIYNLIAIAVDRYIAIVYPLHYSRYMTKRVATLIIMFGWMLSSCVSTVPIYWNCWDSALESPPQCELHNILPARYVTLVMAPFFATVWLTLLLVYLRIWREAAGHAKRLRTTNYYQNSIHNNDWKSVQVVLLVLGCFSICWLPYLVVACVQATDLPLSCELATLYKLAFSLAMANSGMNPIIYAWKNTGFRKAFTRLLRCRSPDCSEYNPSFRHNYVHNTTPRSSRAPTRASSVTMAVVPSPPLGVVATPQPAGTDRHITQREPPDGDACANKRLDTSIVIANEAVKTITTSPTPDAHTPV